MSVSKTWPLDKYPDGCLNCTRSNVAYSGQRGLCATCYPLRNQPEKMARRRAKYATTVSEQRPTFEPVEDDSPEGFSVVPLETEPLTINDAETSVASGEQRPRAEFSLSPDEPAARPSVPPARPPEVPSESAVDKLGRVLGFKRGPKPTDPAYRPPPPPPPKDPDDKKRKSMAEDVERIFTGVGARLTRTDSNGHYLGRHPGLGHYLTWNGPATGEVLEENLANTWPDKKIIQPVIRAEDKFSAIAGVAAPPLLILAIETNPKLVQPLYYPLYLAIEASLDSLGPARKKAKARAEKREANMRENFGDIPPGVDPVRAMIQDMFPWAEWSDDNDEPPVYPESNIDSETTPAPEGATT